MKVDAMEAVMSIIAKFMGESYLYSFQLTYRPMRQNTH